MFYCTVVKNRDINTNAELQTGALNLAPVERRYVCILAITQWIICDVPAFSTAIIVLGYEVYNYYCKCTFTITYEVQFMKLKALLHPALALKCRKPSNKTMQDVIRQKSDEVMHT